MVCFFKNRMGELLVYFTPSNFIKMLYNKGNICFGGDNLKVIAKPIEVVVWTDIRGNIHPVRFKITNEDESNFVVKIDKVICVDKEKLAGNNMLVYKCQSVINGLDKLYEIKYELSSCRWILFKI
ncbi:MAG: hypothetical protein ACJAX4_002466 [Clostridium sp.]|jgi:hypothetical protein